MKKIVVLLIIFASGISSAQNGPIDFESGGFGADWTWTVFENDTNPELEIVANPDPSGINTSATVAKFTALQAGQPFAGVESMHGADIGTFTINSDNAFVSIKVWKSVISDVGIKFATPAGGSTGEIKVPNTVVNQWEEIVVDFTDVIGINETMGVDQIIVFPDFNARTSDEIIYFDDITFSDGVLEVSEVIENNIITHPNPVKDFWSIKSQNEIKQISLFNLIGQRVLVEKPNTTEFNLDLTSLKTGVYIVNVETSNGKESLKLIRE